MSNIYNKDLKNNDELKKQLIMLVRSDNLSVAGAARALGISERTAQSFYNAETQWAFTWWQENGETVDKYFNGFGGKTVGDMIQELHDDPLADIFKGTWLECKDDSITPADIKGSFEWSPHKSDEEEEKLVNKAKHLLNIEKAKKFYDTTRSALVSGDKMIRIPSQYLEEDANESDAEILDAFLKCMESLSKNEENGVLNQYGFPIPEDQWESLGFSVKKKGVVDKPEVYKVDKQGDNSRILILSDIHFPYQHKDLFKFLQHLKDKYNPTRVICMGDEMDHHALSFHDSDPDLPSAGDELRRALPFVQELYKMFPEMDILDSNHGSLVYRKAKHHGVPKHYIKSYNDVLGVGEGWKWSYDLTIDLPNGTKCYFHHGKSPDVVKLSQVMGMSAVQGHYHSVFKVDYWANPNGLYFGMQTGCLVDRDAYAFAYENCNLKKPIIGTGLIINSQPVLEPLIMNEFGDWVGK